MCAKNLLHSLYQYKAWSEDVLFRCLKAPISQSFPGEMEEGLLLAQAHQYCGPTIHRQTAGKTGGI